MTRAAQVDDSVILSRQSQALLGDYHDEATEKTERANHENLLAPSQPRKHQSTFLRIRRTYALVIPAVLLAVVLLATLDAKFNRPSTSSVSLTSKVYNVSAIHTDDYVLDAHWDFSAPPTRREYHWRIDDTDHNPDGVYRPMILINRQFPGPLIECNEGDTVIVHIENRAVNATSFHWHGIYQNSTNWMDGTVGITQCPIAPGTSFTYEFVIENQAGTYWYHAHQGVQPSDGLLGPLIVHAKDEREVQKLEYATDRVVMVQDHYHNLSSALLMNYLKPDRENAEPVPDGALINGMNVRDCDKLSHKDCNNSTATRPIFDLTANENHRLRIVNTGAFAEFQIQLDEHTFAVTEVDGTDVEPVFYHRLNISPGQRYSIIVSTNVTTADSFWLRARMVTACFAEENPDLEPEVRAIIQYENDNVTRGTFKVPQSKDWDETIEVECRDMNMSELVPVRIVAAPAKVDETFYLRSNFEIGAWRLSRGFFNTSTWRPDVYSPSLDRVMNYTTHDISFATQPTGINDRAFDLSNEMVVQIPGIQTIDLLISNFDDGNHPLHLHGYKYFVLAQGHGYFHPSMYATIDLSNPLRRDTASVEAFGWILIRLVTDNPGIWAFHCHISWHTEAGLMMQLLVQPEIIATWDLPEDNRELCRGLGLEKGAGPKDEIWYEENS